MVTGDAVKKNSHMAVLGNMKIAILPAAHHSPEQKQCITGGEKDVRTSDDVKAMMNAFFRKTWSRVGKDRQNYLKG